MQEVLKYLRANGYKTYIVTGGGQDFVRVYAEQTYGIPPEQVVGTALGQSTVMRKMVSPSSPRNRSSCSMTTMPAARRDPSLMRSFTGQFTRLVQEFLSEARKLF